MQSNPNKKKSTKETTTDSFKIASLGNTLYSCDLCRKKKIKCSGVRPKCDVCVANGGFCKYKEVQLFIGDRDGVVSLRNKMNNLNKALNRIKGAQNLSIISDSFIPIDPFQASISKKNELKTDSKNSRKFIVSNQNSDFFTSLGVKKETPLDDITLEIGFLDIEDDLYLKIMENFFIKSFFSLTLSKYMFMERFKNKDIPILFVTWASQDR
ncbi:hypothetical protein AYI68_g1614 [Smittium mucronatum]|uniref:Zn(2)-C6 fungal-type domain-containing protein n=1 Tax=Smittium mucronatum TaxID=133383 RepID=A0A1R0H516_9FUNG|nr:hypothetical protein AYI68_g1614 [Smittium mucronatum]